MKGKTIRELRVGESSEKQDLIIMENGYKYASITGDHNPIHFETEEAYQSRYKRPISHGMVLAGFISGVIGSSLPGEGCIYVKQSLKFLRPVYYGDTILTRVSVFSLDIDRNRVTLRTECYNQNQEIVLEGEAAVIPRKETD